MNYTESSGSERKDYFHSNAKWQAMKRKNSNPRQEQQEGNLLHLRKTNPETDLYILFLEKATTWGMFLLVKARIWKQDIYRIYLTPYTLKLFILLNVQMHSLITISNRDHRSLSYFPNHSRPSHSPKSFILDRMNWNNYLSFQLFPFTSWQRNIALREYFSMRAKSHCYQFRETKEEGINHLLIPSLSKGSRRVSLVKNTKNKGSFPFCPGFFPAGCGGGGGAAETQKTGNHLKDALWSNGYFKNLSQ